MSYHYRASTRLKLQDFDIRLENEPRVRTLIRRNLEECKIFELTCLQNLRNPMLYEHLDRQQVPYMQLDLMGLPLISDMMLPSPPKYS